MITEVNIGHVAVMQRSGTLTAVGVSSCVIIMVFDKTRRVAAMAHAMLPGTAGASVNGHGATDTHYVDTAVEELIRQVVALGADRAQLDAKIVGGANVFPKIQQPIPRQNIVTAKAKLKAEGIHLVGEITGGVVGRSVELDVATGCVTVKSKI
jgi:chemotaxis protein CheD